MAARRKRKDVVSSPEEVVEEVAVTDPNNNNIATEAPEQTAQEEEDKPVVVSEAVANDAALKTASGVQATPAVAPAATPAIDPSLKASIQGDINRQFEQSVSTPTVDTAASQSYNPQPVDESRKALEEGYDAQYQSMADVIQSMRDAHKTSDAGAQTEIENRQRAGRWANTTTLLAGLANLAGVSAGAAPQQYRNYGADWMQQADSMMRERRLRNEQSAQTLAGMEAKLAALKQQKGAALAKYDQAERRQRELNEYRMLQMQSQSVKNNIANMKAQADIAVKNATAANKDAVTAYWNNRVAAEERKLQEIDSRIAANEASAFRSYASGYSYMKSAGVDPTVAENAVAKTKRSLPIPD